MKDKEIQISKILKEYDPVESFSQKHKDESDEEFKEWLNK